MRIHEKRYERSLSWVEWRGWAGACAAQVGARGDKAIKII